MTVTLFPTCPLAGCPNLTDHPGRPCQQCLDLFGDWLRPPDGELRPADEVAAERAAGDLAVARIFAERRAMQPLPDPEPGPERERRRNQTCWCCEQRRTCSPDPSHPDRWICTDCEEIA